MDEETFTVICYLVSAVFSLASVLLQAYLAATD